MDVERLRLLVDQNLVLNPNDDLGQEACWKEMIEILVSDIEGSIVFFEKVCTDEEFYCLSAVFEDIVKITQSVELVEALHKRLNMVTKEMYSQQKFISKHMRTWVDYEAFIRGVKFEIECADLQLIK